MAFNKDSVGMTSKNRGTEVELVLKPVGGGKPKGSTGLVDTQLFTGTNKLFMIMDTQTCFWYPKYERGMLPPVFRQKFTSYHKCLNFIKEYMLSRNIEVVEIKE